MMNTIKKNRSLISIIVFLLLTNIAMLIFFVALNKPSNKSEEQGRFSTSLQKDVGFTKEQFDQYQSLKKAHLENIKPLFDEVRNSKFGLYNLLYALPVADSAVNNAAELIGSKQKEVDLQIFRHFERVRKICTPEQLPKFDSALNKLIIRMTSRPGKTAHNH